MDSEFDPLELLLASAARAAYAETDEGKAEAAAYAAAYKAEVEARCAEARAHICPKCNGEGRLAHYWRIAGGECFKCGGTGRI